jgi:hypothetical protein
MTESSKSKPWWFVGLFFRLMLVSFLSLIISFVLAGTFIGLGFNRQVSWGLIVIGNVAVFAWAIYFRLPFFLSRTNRQRFLISTVIAVPTFFLTYYCVVALLTAAWDSASTSDRRTESVTLPSGEVLENHTYLRSDWGSDRYNTLFLKNPATGASEQINDLLGCLNYEAGPNDPSLLQRYPHPQEFTFRNKKVLVIGSYRDSIYTFPSEFDIARTKAKNGPLWNKP